LIDEGEMKKLLKIVLVLVVLLVAAVLVVPFLIPAETYKAEIIRQVYAQTGRTLKIDGDVNATIYPAIGAKLGKVSLSNPEGFSSATLVELNELTVDVALMPLLRGEVQVQRFLLDQPIIHLEINSRGKANWEFEPQGSPAPTARGLQLVSSAHADEQMDEVLKTLSRLQLGEVKITDGTVFFSDKKSKQEQSASKVNLTVELPSVDAPFRFVGDAVWNAEKVAVDLSVATLRDLLSNRQAKTVVSVKSAHVNLAFDGVATLNGAKGKTQFATPSLLGLAQWAGAGFEWQGKGKLAFDTKGELNCRIDACDYTNATLQLDSLNATGDLGIVLDKVPEVKARLATDLLDTADFLPASPEQQAQWINWLIASAHAAPHAGWSTDPIDLSGLRAVDADVAISAERIRHEAIELGKTVLHTVVDDGVLSLDLVETALYGGEAKGRVTANTAGRITAQFSGEGVQSEPFLKAMTGDDRLSGALAFNLDVQTQGKNQLQLVNALNGKGMTRFTDGALKGINIAQMVRDAKSIISQQQNDTQKTDFAELGGTFTIANGIIRNEDLLMRAPLFRLSGKGVVDLPQMTVDYRLLPTLVNTLKGQGGADDKAGLQVPILVQGPLTAPTYRPDLAGMAQDYLNDPSKAKEQLKDLKAGLKEGKTDLKEQLKEGKAGLKELKNPDALKGLLQGFGGGSADPQQ
jgi:AsmA protein